MSDPLVVIGDAIIDVLENDDGTFVRLPGGAALNLAVGLAVLGLPVVQLTTTGIDRDGGLLRRYLNERGVTMCRAPGADFTGVATSQRINGEPTYSFSPSMLRRHYSFGTAAITAMEHAPAVVVDTYPLDRPEQVDRLYDALSCATGLRVIDPNPRPALVGNVHDYRAGFERIASLAALVKVSDEDIDLLYGVSADRVVGQLLDSGATAVLHTRGAAGARLVRSDDIRINVPIAQTPGPVTDTLGAGDATLAVVVAGLLTCGIDAPAEALEALLTRAMQVAAATARAPGGLLRLP